MVHSSAAYFSKNARMTRVLLFLDRLTQSRRIMAALAAIALVSCTITYGVMARRTGNINTAYWLLNVDLVLLLLLGTVVARHIVRLWMERKRGIAGSKLHVRLVAVFSLLATVPAILMAIFSSIFLYFGVHAWFNNHVSTAIHESQAVAQAYMKEHQQVMRADVLAMANDLNREALPLSQNTKLFDQVIDTQSMLRNLSEAIVMRGDGTVIAHSHLSFALAMDEVPRNVLKQADQGDVALLTGDGSDRIRAIVKLDRFFDTYLYVGRLVDATVLQHMKTTQTAVDEYNTLEKRQSQMQITATFMFMAVALLLLLAAVWFGLAFSERLVAPVSALILATEKVRMGDMDARVRDTQADDEIGMLGRAFNRMTDQIKSQQEALIAANRMLDERRRQTEAILAGASSGVIGLDHAGAITLANLMAEDLLQGAANNDNLAGRRLSDFIPETQELLKKAQSQPNRAWPVQVEYAVGTGPRKTLLLRITAEAEERGAVATIDDISALVSAQRKAAWADVARRIAHEIKNPLTPIQLSAERLRRKYLPQIQEDPETFEKCTETIIRQVGDIGHMVNEFSAYARMPVPVKKAENVVAVCQDALVLQKQAYPDIVFGFVSAQNDIHADVDRLQISQVMTNLLQNAIDSIHERQTTKAGEGRVMVMMESKDENVCICVEDNGTGLPEKVRDQLLEPYVTTKKKGSGLGLAIVKKIMEDHSGSVVLEDSTANDVGSGAKAVLVFPENA